MLSFGKILLVIVVIVLAVIGWGAFRRLGRGVSAGPGRKPAGRARRGAIAAEDTRKCRTCGAFVTIDAGPCDRPSCPQA